MYNLEFDKNPFDKLPNEILDKIVKYIPENFLELRGVNRRFKNFIDDFTDQIPEFAKIFTTSNNNEFNETSRSIEKKCTLLTRVGNVNFAITIAKCFTTFNGSVPGYTNESAPYMIMLKKDIILRKILEEYTIQENFEEDSIDTLLGMIESRLVKISACAVAVMQISLHNTNLASKYLNILKEINRNKDFFILADIALTFRVFIEQGYSNEELKQQFIQHIKSNFYYSTNLSSQFIDHCKNNEFEQAYRLIPKFYTLRLVSEEIF